MRFLPAGAIPAGSGARKSKSIPMKISIGMKLQPGAWGGGNQFGVSFAQFLRKQGVEVSFDLKDPDLDIIFLTEPRTSLAISAYTDADILRYLVFKNKRALVIHRINECDERKGTEGVNQRIMQANQCADYTVFISGWLKDLYFQQGIHLESFDVLPNGADAEIFNPKGYKKWTGDGKLKLVTHHWGASFLKGFDIYERVDKMLGQAAWCDKIEFTFIGNVPQGFKFVNSLHLLPQSGSELAASLRKNHIYLTASQNEPAGMHHIEGAMCGLPLLYRESGALPEYCNGFGISFTEHNFEQKLSEMMEAYDHWVGKMKDYPHTADRMCEQYYQLCFMLLNHRDEILARRKWPRRLLWLAKTIAVK
jgi:hypothetical protein